MSTVRRHAPTLVCALLATAAVFALDVHRPLDLGDESYVYLLSRAWASGEHLFARFQVLYPAGQ